MSHITAVAEYLGDSSIRVQKLADLYAQFTWADDSASSSSSDDEGER